MNYPITYHQCLEIAEEFDCIQWNRIPQNRKDSLLPYILLEAESEDLIITKELAECISMFIANKNNQFSDELRRVMIENFYVDVDPILQSIYNKAADSVEYSKLPYDDQEIESMLFNSHRYKDLQECLRRVA